MMFTQDLKILVNFFIFLSFWFSIAHGHYMGVLDEKIKIWKLSLTWEQIHEEQRMRGAFRIFIDENMRRARWAGEREGALNLFHLPPHACWPEQISIRWTTVWLFGVPARTKTATHVAVDRMGESWPFVLRASMTFSQQCEFKGAKQ